MEQAIYGYTRTKFAMFIYGLSFLGFTALATWDLTILITAYIKDNRLTSVNPINVDYAFPFLENMRVCLKYRNSILKPDVQSQYDYFKMANSSWRGETTVWEAQNGLGVLSNLSEAEQSIAKSMFDVYMTKLIGNLDNFGFTEDASEDPINEAAAKLEISRSNFLALMDKFITNPINRIDLTKQAWSIAHPRFVGPAENLIIPVYELLSYNSYCFAIPLRDVLTLNNSMVEYLFDMTIKGPITSKSTAEENVYFNQNQFSVSSNSISKSDLTTMIINIKNIAIFNNTQFPPCTKDFDNENHCLHDLKMRTIAEICNCIQFTRILTNELSTENVTKNDHRPFCTMKIYNECWDRAKMEAERQSKETKSKGLCTPCVLPKNSYTRTMSSTFVTDFDYLKSRPQLRMKIECSDRMFIFFEGKPQFSLTQFISQVGGDLGLYIGFSMLSILDVMWLIYRICQRSKVPPSVDVSSPNASAMCKSSSDTKHPEVKKTEQEINQSIKDLNQRFEEHKKKSSGMISEMKVQANYWFECQEKIINRCLKKQGEFFSQMLLEYRADILAEVRELVQQKDQTKSMSRQFIPVKRNDE